MSATPYTQYRYLHDVSIGDGATDPSVDGPGTTFPLKNVASGLNDTVRCEVWVYAAMSGGTDTGSIGISHKDGAGGMTAIEDVITGISGTSFQWYPALDAEPTTIDLRTDVDFDRVLVCGKSTGSTDYLRVAAYTIVPVPSVNIT